MTAAEIAARLKPAFLATWAGVQFATALMCVTIKPDERWWFFAGTGVVFFGLAVRELLKGHDDE